MCAAVRRTMATEVSDDVLLKMVRSIVPPLSPHFYKGQCGRIVIVGGCKELVLSSINCLVGSRGAVVNAYALYSR